MKIGDKVKIKNFEEMYQSYLSKFKKMGFKEPEQSKIIYDTHLFRDKIFTIFSKSRHKLDGNVKIFGIEDADGNQFLFAKKGIELVSSCEEKLKSFEEAMKKVIEFNYQQAKDQYGDRNKAKGWACVRTLEDAISK